MIIILFFIIHWYLCIFFQSFFLHRYAAHRHFTMSKNWERFFYICCFVTQGSSYISAYAYGIMHRLHHEYADKKEDPHSPVNHPGFFSLMMHTRNNYYNIFSGQTSVDTKLKKDLPQWKAFDKIAHNWITRVCWIILYCVFYILFAEHWCYYFLLPFTIIMGTLQGAVVNWWAHKFGYVTYKTSNHSKNILPVDLFFFGEAYHNNHHKFPGRPNNAHKWFEVDALYFVMKQMNRVGIIRLKNNA